MRDGRQGPAPVVGLPTMRADDGDQSARDQAERDRHQELAGLHDGAGHADPASERSQQRARQQPEDDQRADTDCDRPTTDPADGPGAVLDAQQAVSDEQQPEEREHTRDGLPDACPARQVGDLILGDRHGERTPGLDRRRELRLPCGSCVHGLPHEFGIERDRTGRAVHDVLLDPVERVGERGDELGLVERRVRHGGHGGLVAGAGRGPVEGGRDAVRHRLVDRGLVEHRAAGVVQPAVVECGGLERPERERRGGEAEAERQRGAGREAGGHPPSSAAGAHKFNGLPRFSARVRGGRGAGAGLRSEDAPGASRRTGQGGPRPCSRGHTILARPRACVRARAVNFATRWGMHVQHSHRA